MSVLYGKVRLLNGPGQNITITDGKGNIRNITTTGESYTDVILPGMEEYTLCNIINTESVHIFLNIGDFKEISLSTYDMNVMANNSWDVIRERIVAGTLPSSFVGQTKPIILGGNTYNLQLAQINDGSGTAGEYYPKHTADFISVELMPDYHNMNSTATNVGSWGSSALRTYLTNTVYPMLPDDLKSVIINKTHRYTQGNKSTSYSAVSDKLWIPTEYECFGTATWGGEDYIYNKHYPIFTDDASRQKTRIGQTAHAHWWESSPYINGNTVFCSVDNKGKAYMSGADYERGIVLGLRIG